MTKDFIDKLNDEELKELLDRFDFMLFNNGFRKGCEKGHKAGDLVIRTWNHDYSSSEDYYNDILYISDYKVKHWLNEDKYEPIHYRFMIEKFEDEWVKKATEHFEKKKSIKKINMIKQIVEEVKKEKEEVSKHKTSSNKQERNF